MKFDCPYGWKAVTKCGNVTLESAIVNICDGIDSCDLCGIESSEFYDTSPEAAKRFLLANALEHTTEHLMAPDQLTSGHRRSQQNDTNDL